MHLIPSQTESNFFVPFLFLITYNCFCQLFENCKKKFSYLLKEQFWVCFFSHFELVISFGKNTNILSLISKVKPFLMWLKKKFKWKLKSSKCIKLYFSGWQLLMTLGIILCLKVSILYVHLGFTNNSILIQAHENYLLGVN